MRIEYESKKVEKLLVDFDTLYRRLGFELQKKLKTTLDRLDAVENFTEFLSLGLGRPHPLKNNLKGYYGVTLTGNIRLILKPKNGLDSSVYIVKGVCDYHGEKNEWIIP